MSPSDKTHFKTQHVFLQINSLLHFEMQNVFSEMHANITKKWHIRLIDWNPRLIHYHCLHKEVSQIMSFSQDYTTVTPVYNDHLMGYLSAFWSSSRWPLDGLQKAVIISKS